jgi:hypothetical protein
MSYGEPDAVANCNTTNDEIASAAGQRKFASFVPNYSGYGDQASYPDLQRNAEKLPQARVRRIAAVTRGQGSKRMRAIEAYKQVAQVDGARSFLQHTPAQ